MVVECSERLHGRLGRLRRMETLEQKKGRRLLHVLEIEWKFKEVEHSSFLSYFFFKKELNFNYLCGSVSTEARSVRSP